MIACFQATRKMASPMRIQRSCAPSPRTSSSFERSPTRASIGKKNAHWKGRKREISCTQSGMSGSGTSRPERSSSAIIQRSKIAAPRVVQKQSIPSASWNIVRSRYAPQIATANTAISRRRGSRTGSKTRGEPDRERDPEHDDDDLPAGEEGDVVVQRQHRPQQVLVELALADPLLPEGRSEDDVHVPDERPDDVVRGEVPGREPLHRAALLVRDRRPDDEVDDGLRDHPEHPEVVGRAVLELLLHGEAHRGQ